VPFAKVAGYGAGYRTVKPAEAASEVWFADAHGHEGLPPANVDPCLEPLPDGQSGHRQAAAIIEEQAGVVEITGSASGKHQVSAQPAR
jgi:hypothetical protein